MSFQTPITIKQALQRIERKEYALPAIQREFVWKPGQICWLFDSLMRGYPIGSFLFWAVEPERSRDFKFYDFVLHYHERENPHCPPLELMEPRALTAVLDGQQRLTAFNIALRGSMATKEPRLWANNPNAYPRKRLYLNLLGEAEQNEQGTRFDFRFLTEAAAARPDPGQFWFPVHEVLAFKNAGPAMQAYLNRHGIGQTEWAFQALYDLYTLVHDKPTISYFLEEEQDLDKVLNIFIRVNSGATKLSYSDLLMSIATAQWDTLDARDAIYRLVDELNGTRDGFDLSKDFVLKAGLMLSDIASVGFKVTNFNAANMGRLERNWERIGCALRTTVRLAADFGFSRQTLAADSALLPIAYYVYRRGLDDGYLTKSGFGEDRQAVRGWLVRSLIKSGIWGAGLDTTLTALRGVIEKHGGESFPVAEIESEMARRGRSLRFTEEEIQDLAEIQYGDRRCFALLSVLYPFVDLRNQFHIDHVFPRAKMTRRRLQEAGIERTTADRMLDAVERLPNLQLLAGVHNQEKSDTLPAEWLQAQFQRDPDRREYCERHDLGDVPTRLDGFEQFYAERKERLMRRIRDVLGAAEPEPTTARAS